MNKYIYKRFLAGFVLVFISAVLPDQLLAHHSLAQFDTSQSTSIHGVIKRVWFNNPHVRYYVAVLNDQGEEEIWDVHTSSVNILVRRGWTNDSLKVGDEVTMFGNPPRDDSHELLIHTVELADGSRVSTRESDLDR